MALKNPKDEEVLEQLCEPLANRGSHITNELYPKFVRISENADSTNYTDPTQTLLAAGFELRSALASRKAVGNRVESALRVLDVST